LGVGKNLLRRLAGDRAAEFRIKELQIALGTYLLLCGVLVTILAPLLIWQAPLLFPVPPAYRTALRTVVALAVADYVLGVPVAVRQTYAMSTEQFDRYARLTVISGLARYGLGFAALMSMPGPVLLVAALVGRRVVEWIVAPLVLGRLPATTWRPRLGEAGVLSVAQLLQLTVLSGGAFLVNWTLGLAALGVYRAVFDLVSKVWLFSNVIGLVVFPRFVHMVRTPSERRRLGGMLPGILTASLGLFGAIAMGAAAVGPTALPVVGLGGRGYVVLFVLMAGGLAFNAHANLSWELVQAAGWYRQVVGLAAVSLISMLLVWGVAWMAQPEAAIGWAWLLGQVPAVVLTDALGLRAAGATWTRGQRVMRAAILVTTVGLAVATVEPAPRVAVPLLLAAGALAVAGSVRNAWGLRTMVLGGVGT
jgi:O-antigen/teichoic acid export membrane protein